MATAQKPVTAVFPRHSVKGYAGIGSRSAPPPVLDLMVELSSKLRAKGWLLRTGHAAGSDQAFERGAGNAAEVFLPWPEYESHIPIMGRMYAYPTIAAHGLGRHHHPTWETLARSVRNLHARNAHIVMGRNLDAPVRFVIAWTPDPFPSGGTGQAVRVAQAQGIAVVNLAQPDYAERLNHLTGPANV